LQEKEYNFQEEERSHQGEVKCILDKFEGQTEQEEEEAGKGEAGTGTNKYETNRRALERFR
jgi:hypothetical protein